MFRNIRYSEISYLDTFDVLIQSKFRVIQKIAFAKLCKAYHDFMIISFVNFNFEIKKLEEKKENHKKLNILQTEFLGEI